MKFKDKKYRFLSPLVVISLSLFFSILIFLLVFNYLKVVSSSILISLFFLTIPFNILKYIVNSNKQKIKRDFPTYAIALQNYTQTDNDILVAFKKVKTEKPLSIYIQDFNIEVEKGIDVYSAFENLKNNINIKKINEFLNAAQVCYTKGGDFTKLINRYSKLLSKENIQIEKEKQERFSSIVVLILLIFINLYFMFSFIFSNIDYKNILLTSFGGKLILNINIISYYIIFLFIQKINKMEE